jgi:hypothetical protein
MFSLLTQFQRSCRKNPLENPEDIQTGNCEKIQNRKFIGFYEHSNNLNIKNVSLDEKVKHPRSCQLHGRFIYIMSTHQENIKKSHDSRKSYVKLMSIVVVVFFQSCS